MTNAPVTKIQDPDEPVGNVSISPVTQALCDYVATTLERDMPPEVVAKTKLHILDTIAAMVSRMCSLVLATTSGGMSRSRVVAT